MSLTLNYYDYSDAPLFPKQKLKVESYSSDYSISFKIVNNALHFYPHKKHFKWMIKLTLVKNYKTGFNIYDKTFNKIESKLLKAKKVSHFISRNFQEDFRETIYYGKDFLECKEFIKPFVNKLKQPEKLKIVLKEDPNWLMVSDYLK